MPLIEGPEGFYTYAPSEEFTTSDMVCGWPFSESCYKPATTDDATLVETAMNLTVATLRSLTLYRVGGCPITVRPCVARCCIDAFNPHLNALGQWVNSCGCSTRTPAAAWTASSTPAPPHAAPNSSASWPTTPPASCRWSKPAPTGATPFGG